jgi:oxygen-independent coproporphyrinogen-3 oxidase
MRRLEGREDPIGGQELLTPENRAAEAVYLGLRTTGGLRLVGDEFERAQRWIRAGWGSVEDDTLRLSPLGWLRLDALAADLTVIRSR